MRRPVPETLDVCAYIVAPCRADQRRRTAQYTLHGLSTAIALNNLALRIHSALDPLEHYDRQCETRPCYDRSRDVQLSLMIAT